MEQYLQAILTILALVNPLVCVAIFDQATQELPQGRRFGLALQAVGLTGAVLFTASILGTTILKALGISLSAFACAGGGILVWIGAGMLTPKATDAGDDRPDRQDKVSLSPLILFAASPGTITGVITVGASHTGHSLPVTAMVGVAVSLAVLAAVMLVSVKFSKGSGKKSDARKLVSSYMGVLIIAMGIQFLFSGIHHYFGG